MTHIEKINYMRIASSICNFGFTNEQLDLLTSIYDLILEKEGKGGIDDVVRIEHAVKGRAMQAAIEERKLKEETNQPK